MNTANSDQQVWPAPAKLNLFLHIIGQREDGYHQLQSVIQFIDFHDELIFKPRTDSEIFCKNLNQDIPEQENLCTRAAKLLQHNCAVKQGVDIQLKKNIPIGAGLGGGSSDAATTLLAMNKLWACGLSKNELENLALQLGADVPIFVRGNTSWVEGVGEQLTPIAVAEPWYVVVYPGVLLNTQEMFNHPDLTRNCLPIKIRDFSQTSNWQQSTKNVFESIARQKHEIERAFQWLNQYLPARLTGSGSSLFVSCESLQQAEEIATNCPQEFEVYLAKGMNISPVGSLV